MTTLTALALPEGAVPDRDALARYLYIHHHADKDPGWLAAGALEWDNGEVSDADVLFFYASADAIITGQVPS